MKKQNCVFLDYSVQDEYFSILAYFRIWMTTPKRAAEQLWVCGQQAESLHSDGLHSRYIQMKYARRVSPQLFIFQGDLFGVKSLRVKHVENQRRSRTLDPQISIQCTLYVWHYVQLIWHFPRLFYLFYFLFILSCVTTWACECGRTCSLMFQWRTRVFLPSKMQALHLVGFIISVLIIIIILVCFSCFRRFFHSSSLSGRLCK